MSNSKVTESPNLGVFDHPPQITSEEIEIKTVQETLIKITHLGLAIFYMH